MSAQVLNTLHELDSRTSDGIHVRMLWSARDGHVTIAVSDSKTGDAFAVDVRAGERAIDVFHHPYAYAAWHEIDVRAPAGAPALALVA